jgi:hypothetical protein
MIHSCKSSVQLAPCFLIKIRSRAILSPTARTAYHVIRKHCQVEVVAVLVANV